MPPEKVRTGLRKVIDKHEDIVVIAEAVDGEEGIALAQVTSPDIILMDVNMPGIGGIGATSKISAAMPVICIIGLSMNDGDTVSKDMKDAGASAYLQKTEMLIR